MMKVFKYIIEQKDSSITMPKGAKVLSVQNQYHKPCIWALCNPDAPKVQRRFLALNTGDALPSSLDLTFLATVQLHGGDTVVHIFEVERYEDL